MDKIFKFLIFLSLFFFLMNLSNAGEFTIKDQMVQFNFIPGAKIGEDYKVIIYDDRIPALANEIISICLPGLDGFYWCVNNENSDFNTGSVSPPGVRYLEFVNPFIFGFDTEASGFLKVETIDDEFFVPYSVENYLPPSYYILVPGDQSILFGTNVNPDAMLNIDGKKIAEIDVYNDEISFELPYDFKSGFHTIQLQEPSSNKIEVYIAPKKNNDPLQTEQWHFVQHSIYEAFEVLKPTEEVIVAVIDNGVYLNHEDLQENIWFNVDELSGNSIDDDGNGYIDDTSGWNFVNHSRDITETGDHGTLIAGIIAAKSNNNLGILGVANKVKLMSLIVFDADGSTSSEAIIEAIYYAVENGADVINLSLGESGAVAFSSEYDKAIRYASDHNVAIVAAAGNGDIESGSGYDLENFPRSPVCNDSSDNLVFGVGAVTMDSLLTEWSNYGACIDIYALGKNVYSTTVPTYSGGALYDFANGTSFSAPVVTGVMAYVKSTYPNISNTALYNYLIESAEDGVLNAEAAFLKIKEEYNTSDEFYYKNMDEGEGGDSIDEDSEKLSNDNSVSSISIFSDLDEGHKNFEAIFYLKENGIINGYPDGTFKPDNTINRAELLKILMESNYDESDFAHHGDTNCFSDVKANEWYTKYICAAKAANIISGYPDGSFKPDQTVNKVEALKMLLNAYGYVSEISEISATDLYDDVYTSAWYAPFVYKAKELGILEETGSMFMPNEGMKRASISENLYRLLTL